VVSRILLAIDNSPSSWEASHFAVHLARALRAEVVVLHVYAPHSIDVSHSLEEDAEYLGASSLVDDVVRALLASGARARSQVVLVGSSGVAGAILTASEEEAADLLVMGTRGRSELAGILLGSVSHEVVTHATCPVMIIRNGVGLPSSARRRILLAVGSEVGRMPLVRLTEELARALAAQVIVVHVEDLADALDEHLARPRFQPLLRSVTYLRKAGLRVKSVITPNRRGIGGELARAADTYAVDLVLIGASRPLSRLEELTLGSSSQGLLHHSHRAVLIDKARSPQRRRSPAPSEGRTRAMGSSGSGEP
jgi:nucleotide-binding universal stress UspA family protein